jgi:UDP-glucose 4-epimerase
VFSSTCATYGAPVYVPMDEKHPQAPLNPYGRSKLMVEQILEDLARYKGFRSVALRYFNAAGADPEGRIGEKHEPETHAIPLAIAAARGERDRFMLFGGDYDTRDGTCVRDYIHVLDLADAHVLALKWLLDGKDSAVFNLGTGTGTTVRELVGAIERRSNRPFPLELAERRAGDAPSLVADNRKARAQLGWTPRHDLDAIIEHAWAWHANWPEALIARRSTPLSTLTHLAADRRGDVVRAQGFRHAQSRRPPGPSRRPGRPGRPAQGL